MGATRLAEVCAALQDAGLSRDLARVAQLLERLEMEYERVRLALVAEVSGSLDDDHL